MRHSHYDLVSTGWKDAVAASSVLILFFSMPAASKDLELRRAVKAGETVELLPHSSMRGDCESKVPKIRIIDEPKNGSAAVKEGERRFEKGVGELAKCDGKVGVGAKVIYTPKSGFEGADKLRYEVTFASGTVTIYNVQIRVGRQDPAGWTKPK